MVQLQSSGGKPVEVGTGTETVAMHKAQDAVGPSDLMWCDSDGAPRFGFPGHWSLSSTDHPGVEHGAHTTPGWLST